LTALADVAALLATHRTLTEATAALIGRYAGPNTDRFRRALDELDGAHAALTAQITPDATGAAARAPPPSPSRCGRPHSRPP
jgi:hypothetical protein